jgi:hypothetical protein
MSMDGVSDVISRFQKDGQSSDTTAFARRLKATADDLFASDISECALRIRLWVRIATSLDLDATRRLSSRRANGVGAGVAWKASSVMSVPVVDDSEETQQTGFRRTWQAVKALRGRSNGRRRSFWKC